MFFGWQTEVMFLLRLLLAGACGFIVGLERKRRYKEAGIRTHFVVSLGACLFMIVSIYGFDSDGDTARVAAQIVTGIGFLDAGMIFYRRDALHGLITAAGVWVTAGIGMAAGAGMYILGVFATLILVVAHLFFGLPLKIFHSKSNPTVIIKFVAEEDAVRTIKEIFCTKEFIKSKLVSDGDKNIYTSELHANIDLTEEKLCDIKANNSFIISVEF